MGLVNLLSRVDRWAGRFNDWFGATAVAAHLGSEGAGRQPPATGDPAAVVGLLGEMEKEDKVRDDHSDESPPRDHF